MFIITIDYQSITQTPCKQFMEAIQDKVVESIGEHDLFQFLGKINCQTNVMNLNTFLNFDFYPKHAKNQGLSNKCMFVALCLLFLSNTRHKHSQFNIFTPSSQNTPNFHPQ